MTDSLRINDEPVTDHGTIDLDEEDVRLADGTRLTEARAQELAREVLERAGRGRPSLSRPGVPPRSFVSACPMSFAYGWSSEPKTSTAASPAWCEMRSRTTWRRRRLLWPMVTSYSRPWPIAGLGRRHLGACLLAGLRARWHMHAPRPLPT